MDTTQTAVLKLGLCLIQELDDSEDDEHYLCDFLEWLIIICYSLISTLQ